MEKLFGKSQDVGELAQSHERGFGGGLRISLFTRSGDSIRAKSRYESECNALKWRIPPISSRGASGISFHEKGFAAHRLQGRKNRTVGSMMYRMKRWVIW